MTSYTLGISKPLAATSDAINTSTLPYLNDFNLFNLLFCSTSPCNNTFLIFKFYEK